MKTKTVKTNEIKVRDALMVRVICGITKAGVQKDRRKEQNRKACRGRAKEEK